MSLRRAIPVVLSIGAGVAGYRYICRTRPILIETEAVTNKSLQVRLYTRLPLNAASRVWGRMNDVELPIWAREPLYKLYIRSFGCNLSEAAITDLKHYRNLGEFFRRQLKPDCRPIDQSAALVCPSDGTVLHCGPISCDRVEQVKGVTYSLGQFLGPASWTQPALTINQLQTAGSDEPDSICRLKYSDKDTQLYHAVIYLAPGDYHGFHSPTEWTVLFRRYFSGLLLSVNPRVAQRVPGLFALNERVVYVGRWKHGFMAMSPVGATNVGSIKVYHDQQLLTNCKHSRGKPCNDRLYQSTTELEMKPVTFSRGDAFGEFNLGSTIVLLFEAPTTFNFAVSPGQRIKLGQELGTINSHN